jgi:hypothetical protein
MTNEQKTQIEQQHNVYVHDNGTMFTTGEREDEYGWMNIPEEWINETTSKGENNAF